jgi:hypothetical protein
MWYRVFGINDANLEPGSLLGHMNASGYPVRARFGVDDAGWYQAEVIREDADEVYDLQRYLADEEGIRDELNTWAASVELVDSLHQTSLMQHMASTQQLFTLRATQGKPNDAFCRRLCQLLARATRGIYQIDGYGFYDAAGDFLAPDEA